MPQLYVERVANNRMPKTRPFYLPDSTETAKKAGPTSAGSVFTSVLIGELLISRVTAVTVYAFKVFFIGRDPGRAVASVFPNGPASIYATRK